VEREKGVLVVVMNYTGDVLNFGMAVEKAKAAGVQVEMVVVGDDVGVGRTKGGKVGRRGIAGTVLVQKIAGALAVGGGSLEDLERTARLAAENVVSIGASLSHVHVPGRSAAEPSDKDLKESEVEIGMGIHNEPGSERKTETLPGLVKTMLAHMLDTSDEDRSFLQILADEETVLLVNNLGGVSPLELGGIVNEVVEQLEKHWKIRPVRILSGTYMTSLNGMGFSISLLKLRDTGLGNGKSMLELLDASTEATGWTAAVSTETWQTKSTAKLEEGDGDSDEARPSNLRCKMKSGTRHGFEAAK
jgi:dihydroxyacetone kinase